MRMSFFMRVACLAAVSFLAAPPVLGAAAPVPAEPLAAAQDSPARLALFSLKTCEHGADGAAVAGELAALVKSVPSSQRSNPGVRFPSPVPPVLVRNPFLSTAP